VPGSAGDWPLCGITFSRKAVPGDVAHVATRVVGMDGGGITRKLFVVPSPLNQMRLASRTPSGQGSRREAPFVDFAGGGYRIPPDSPDASQVDAVRGACGGLR
jgi:hypothetical protein